MTWLSVKMGLNFIVANDPNQMTLHFTFPVFRLQPTERWKWLTNGDGVGRNGKESESCLYLCRLLYYFRRSHRKKKKNFLMEPWSSLQYGKKEKKKLFSPTRCLWEHSTFSSICFYITVQAWTNNESSLGTSILRFLSFFSSTTYRKNEIIPVEFFLISSGKKWKWSLSLSFFFC